MFIYKIPVNGCFGCIYFLRQFFKGKLLISNAEIRPIASLTIRFPTQYSVGFL